MSDSDRVVLTLGFITFRLVESLINVPLSWTMQLSLAKLSQTATSAVTKRRTGGSTN